MSKIKHLAAFVALLLVFLCSSLTTASARNPLDPRRPSPPTSTGAGGPTGFQVYNPSHPDVDVWVVLPESSNLGCGPTLLTQLRVLDLNNNNPLPITQFADNVRLGSFKLMRGRSAKIEPINGKTCLDGLNVTFLNHPQCPCTNTCAGTQPGVPGPNLPNGTNFVEATLNCPGTFLETVDISCVNGANTTIAVDFQGGPNWNDGVGNNNVQHIQNSWVNVNCSGAACDNNCSLTGVYPYNATECEHAAAGACPNASSPPFCLATNKHCNIQRGRENGNFGGVVKATYLGPLAPPN
ncbi:MAG: hypothetical protein JST89_25000 [Cyanobacteria bacterium SZAS-4]|nr:hypothetical protein [Cyanobacteria bacterium SZAS-4]